jgi:hypothetical protein
MLSMRWGDLMNQERMIIAVISENAISALVESSCGEIRSHSDDISRSSPSFRVSSFSAALWRTFPSAFLVSRAETIFAISAFLIAVCAMPVKSEG